MNQRIPPIQCLLAFEALARRQSVTQAAKELYVTPSAACHRIKKLEDVLGVKLFASDGFALTEVGATYIEDVRAGLGCLQRFPYPVSVPSCAHLGCPC